jgi:RNA polymerase sigma-70 factor (ECF subfamily)
MSGAAPESEREMAALLRRGEASAIEWLYDRYARLAFGLAFHMLKDASAAEDVVQDAFLAIWRNALRFDAGRGSLRAWLLAIVRNRAIDQLRGRAAAPPVVFDASAAPEGEFMDAWEAMSIELERKQVREALASLPLEQRQSIELAYFEGLSQSEIATRLALPLGTVKGRLRLALEKVRSFLQARGLEP